MNQLSQLVITRDAEPDWEYMDELLRHERHTLLKAYGRQALVAATKATYGVGKVVINGLDEWIKSV